jgi:hypothetical protein
VASVPQMDDPETPIDESDFQVSFAIPSIPSIKLVHQLANSIASPKLGLCHQALKSPASSQDFMPVPKQSRSHSILRLLCTFLI